MLGFSFNLLQFDYFVFELSVFLFSSLAWFEDHKTGGAGKEKKEEDVIQKDVRDDDAEDDNELTIPKIFVKILLRNHEIAPYPALPTVRTIFLQALHDYIGIVCLLPKPTSGRFEVFGGCTSSGVNPSSFLSHRRRRRELLIVSS